MAIGPLEKNRWSTKSNPVFFVWLTFWRQPHVSCTWPTQLQCSAVSLPVLGPGRGQSLPKMDSSKGDSSNIHPKGIWPANIRRNYQIIIDYHDFIHADLGLEIFAIYGNISWWVMGNEHVWLCMTDCMTTSCFRGRVVLNQNGVWLPCATVMGLE